MVLRRLVKVAALKVKAADDAEFVCAEVPLADLSLPLSLNSSSPLTSNPLS